MVDDVKITDAKTEIGATQAAGSAAENHGVVAETGALIDRYIGIKVGGRYQIEKELGRGGIGVVYLARDQQLLSKQVVIKVLLDDAGADEWVKNKFRHEIEALTRIDHPGVIGALDTGQMPDGKPYFVMQFVEGVNLRSVMKPEGMDLARVANIVKQLGSALSAAHDKGVFHRDLKPENVMIQIGEREDRVKLIDFGIAKVHNSQSGHSTQVPIVAGTFNYMSPEQLTGEPVTAASDTYAFAIMAYEMITGRRPFTLEAKAASAMLLQLLEQQQNGPRLKPQDLRPTISDEAQAVIMRAFAYDPTERQARAQDFGDELSAALLIAPKPAVPRKFTAQTNGASPKPTTNLDAATTANQTSNQHETNLNGGKFQPSQSADRQVNAVAETPKKSNTGIIIAIVAVILAIGIGAVVIPKLMKKDEPVVNNVTSTPGASPTPTGPERQLSYWLMVQKFNDDKPNGAPFRLSREMLFEENYGIKLDFSSPQSGYFYILNEGPPDASGKQQPWNTLFPSPNKNGGSSALAANTEIEIGTFIIKGGSGTEKLWLVWSESKVDQLEVLQKWVNPQDKGQIKDPAQMDAARKFVEANAKNAPKVETDDDKKLTMVKGQGKTIVSLIKLEHH